MGIVYEPMEGGVCDVGSPMISCQMFAWQLACHDGGAAAAPTLHDFQEVAALARQHPRHSVGLYTSTGCRAYSKSDHLKTQLLVRHVWLADILARLLDHPAKRIDELRPSNQEVAGSNLAALTNRGNTSALIADPGPQ